MFQALFFRILDCFNSLEYLLIALKILKMHLFVNNSFHVILKLRDLALRFCFFQKSKKKLFLVKKTTLHFYDTLYDSSILTHRKFWPNRNFFLAKNGPFWPKMPKMRGFSNCFLPKWRFLILIFVLILNIIYCE